MGGAGSVNVSPVSAGQWLAMTRWQSTTHSVGCTTSLASTKAQVPEGGGRLPLCSARPASCLSFLLTLVLSCCCAFCSH